MLGIPEMDKLVALARASAASAWLSATCDSDPCWSTRHLSRDVREPRCRLSRFDRHGCEYEAYVPGLFAGRRFRLEGSIAADMADAERALAPLDVSAAALANTEAFARLLLRVSPWRPPASKGS